MKTSNRKPESTEKETNQKSSDTTNSKKGKIDLNNNKKSETIVINY